MQGIQKVTIEECNVKNLVTFTQKYGKDKGKEAQLWNIGLKIDDTWYNGALFSKTEVDAMSERTEAELFFYEEEYNGTMYKKWRIVKDKDREFDQILKRIEALEKRMDARDAEIKGFKTPITNQVNQDAQAPIDTTDDEGQPDDLEEKQVDDLPF